MEILEIVGWCKIVYHRFCDFPSLQKKGAARINIW